MIEAELTPVVVASPLLQKCASPRVMELTIVQDDEARIADQIGPDVVVIGRIAKLIDDKLVRLAEMLPDEIVCVAHNGSCIRTGEPIGRPVDEHVDLMR